MHDETTELSAPAAHQLGFYQLATRQNDLRVTSASEPSPPRVSGNRMVAPPDGGAAGFRWE